MKTALKWIGIVLGGLLALVVVFAGVMFTIGTSRLNKTYSITPEPMAIPTDADSLARGQYIVTAYCTGCHGENLAGKVLLEDPALGYFPASNLTSGAGGIGRTYTDADWVTAIRHGVRPDGQALMIMPSGAFYHYSDSDLGSIIAYLKSRPAVDNDLGSKSAAPVGRIMLALGAFGNILAAETIDHTGPRPAAPEMGMNAAYGEYLVNTGDCRSCHGENLAGGQSSEPGSPPSPNLTSGGNLASWSADDFRTTIRTGTTPEGAQLDPAFMPWEHIARLTDEDLDTIFIYLQSLPALETGG